MRFVILAQIALLAGLLSGSFFAPNASAQLFRGAPDRPLTLTLRSKPDSQGGFRETTVAFRADGSKAERMRLYRPDAPASFESGWRHVWDRTAGVSVGVMPMNRTKVTQPLQESPPGFGPPSGPRCVDPFRPGADSADSAERILGYRVVKLSFTTPMGDGAVLSSEEWRAPELGCLPLRRQNAIRRADGAVVSSNLEEAVVVELGPPDETLFVIPGDYTEQAHLFEAERAKTFSWRRGDPE